MKPACIPGKEKDQSIPSYRCNTEKTNLASVKALLSFLRGQHRNYFLHKCDEWAVHNHKKGFDICQYILEARRESLLVLRIVKYGLRLKPVHPVWDECNLVDCKGIWELVFQLWECSKTLVFYSLVPKSCRSSLFGDLTCSTSWNRPLRVLIVMVRGFFMQSDSWEKCGTLQQIWYWCTLCWIICEW